MTQNELYHYGVLGMKWGVRKQEPFSAKAAGHRAMAGVYGINENYYKKRAGKKGSIWKNNGSTMARLNASAKNRQLQLANQAQKAKTAQVNAKNKRKQAINSTYKNLNKNTSFGEKLVYNNATRKKAAKYVVDNNMTVSEATKKAKGDAWKNTAAFLALYGIGTAVVLKAMR